jgi:HK97 family phage major capsid protein
MLNDAYLKEIAKFTVGTGDVRPVWIPSTREGEPDRILGYPYVVNQSMASGLTTGTIGVVFGDLSKYVIRNVRDMFLVRLDELYATQGQVGFVAFSRQDGDLLDAGTNPVKYLALA